MAPLPTANPDWMNLFGYNADGTDVWFPHGYTWEAIQKGFVTIGEQLSQGTFPTAYVDPKIVKAKEEAGVKKLADPFCGKLWVKPLKPPLVMKREALLVQEVSSQPEPFYRLSSFWLFLSLIAWAATFAALFQRSRGRRAPGKN